MRRLANTLRRLPETHFRPARDFAGTAKPIEEPANELAVALTVIRKALKLPGKGPKAVAGTAKEIEVRWKGKGRTRNHSIRMDNACRNTFRGSHRALICCRRG